MSVYSIRFACNSERACCSTGASGSRGGFGGQIQVKISCILTSGLVEVSYMTSPAIWRALDVMLVVGNSVWMPKPIKQPNVVGS